MYITSVAFKMNVRPLEIKQNEMQDRKEQETELNIDGTLQIGSGKKISTYISLKISAETITFKLEFINVQAKIFTYLELLKITNDGILFQYRLVEI